MFNSMWFLICLCFSKGQLALLHKDQQIEAPQSNAKLEENTLSKIEETLVWLNQCKTNAKKALGANSTGQTSNFMKAILKTKSGELISLQSKIQEIKISCLCGQLSLGQMLWINTIFIIYNVILSSKINSGQVFPFFACFLQCFFFSPLSIQGCRERQEIIRGLNAMGWIDQSWIS